MSNQEIRAERERMLGAAVAALGEHFDSVLLLATVHEECVAGGTCRFERGCGNWYAQFGHACEWVEQERERSRVEVMREMALGPEEGAEGS